MRSQSLTALFALLGATNVHARSPRHLEVAHKRQATTTTTSRTTTPTGVTVVPAATGTAIPPLESITFGMPTGATLPVTATWAAGASAPVSGAPTLPTPCMSPNAATYPYILLMPYAHSRFQDCGLA